MDWEFHYREDGKYLEILISGEVTSEELNRMAEERWAELQKHGCDKILFDFSAVTKMISTLQLYGRPDELKRKGAVWKYDAAAVYPERFKAEFAFMETVYRNRAVELRMFPDRKAALEHLNAAHRDSAGKE